MLALLLNHVNYCKCLHFILIPISNFVVFTVSFVELFILIMSIYMSMKLNVVSLVCNLDECWSRVARKHGGMCGNMIYPLNT